MGTNSLADVAAVALVSAVVTDGWENIQPRVGRLFGRGRLDPATERRLEATRDQLSTAPSEEMGQVKADLAAQWATRLADLIADSPDVEADLRALVGELWAARPDGAVSARDHSVAGRKVVISADHDGIAAGVINGKADGTAAAMPDKESPVTGPGAGPESLPSPATSPRRDSRIKAAHRGIAAERVTFQQRAPGGRPVSLPRRPELAGREDLLSELHARLAEGSGGGPRIVVLHGLGGVGKTSVAVEYAHRHLAEAGVVWQFSAEDATVMTDQFARLAAQLEAAGEPGDLGDPVASVHATLRDTGMPWMLLFDNARNETALRQFVPPAGNGRVLITSQNALWPAGNAVLVPPLDLNAAAGFLKARTGDIDEDAARGLAAELGSLPLALEQAASHIVAVGSGLAGYLDQFRAMPHELLDPATPAGVDKTVAATLRLAFEQLQLETPAATGVLHLLACCAPEPVPLRHLLRPHGRLPGQLAPEVAEAITPLLNKELTVEEAIRALRRYSLVTSAGEGQLMMHRLVQDRALAELPERLAADWRRVAAALLDAAIPGDTDLPAAWPDCAALLPHARAALAADSDAIERIANYLGMSGSYAAARELQQEIADARRRSAGARDLGTLRARAKLAEWTGRAGDPAAARDQYAKLLRVRRRVSGARHPDTLAARAARADWTGEAGQPRKARDQYAKLIPALAKVHGPEHAKTLLARAALASLTDDAGQPRKARDQYAKLLPDLERALGADHPETLSARLNHILCAGAAGSWRKARKRYARVMPDLSRVLGPEHPETLFARAQLAYITGNAGDARKAAREYAELVDLLSRVLGPEHPATLTARYNHVFWTWEAAAAAGRAELARLRPVIEQVCGAKSSLAKTARKQHRFLAEEARRRRRGIRNY